MAEIARLAVARGWPRIDLSVTIDAADVVSIDVVDNGKGFPNEGRQKLLEPYVTTREKGTGLGLAIVNKIVEEHGGEMTFASLPGGGAAVTMRFGSDPLAGRRGAEAAE